MGTVEQARHTADSRALPVEGALNRSILELKRYTVNWFVLVLRFIDENDTDTSNQVETTQLLIS